MLSQHLNLLMYVVAIFSPVFAIEKLLTCMYTLCNKTNFN